MEQGEIKNVPPTSPDRGIRKKIGDKLEIFTSVVGLTKPVLTTREEVKLREISLRPGGKKIGESFLGLLKLSPAIKKNNSLRDIALNIMLARAQAEEYHKTDPRLDKRGKRNITDKAIKEVLEEGTRASFDHWENIKPYFIDYASEIQFALNNSLEYDTDSLVDFLEKYPKPLKEPVPFDRGSLKTILSKCKQLNYQQLISLLVAFRHLETTAPGVALLSMAQEAQNANEFIKKAWATNREEKRNSERVIPAKDSSAPKIPIETLVEKEVDLPKFDLEGYTRIKTLGEGEYCSIDLYQHPQKEPVVLKSSKSFSLSKEALVERQLYTEAQALLALKHNGRDKRVISFKGMTRYPKRESLALVEEALLGDWQPLIKLGDSVEQSLFMDRLSLTPLQKLKIAMEMVGLFDDLYHSRVLSTFEFKGESLFIKLDKEKVSLKALDLGLCDKIEWEEVLSRKQQMAGTIFSLLVSGSGLGNQFGLMDFLGRLNLSKLTEVDNELPAFAKGLFEKLFSQPSAEIQINKEHGRTQEELMEKFLSQGIIEGEIADTIGELDRKIMKLSGQGDAQAS